MNKLAIVHGLRRSKLDLSNLYFLIIGMIFALAYLFFVPFNTGPKYDLSLRSVSEIDSNSVNKMVFKVEKSLNMSSVYPFRADLWFGYINEDGSIAFREKLDYEVELTDRYFVNYSLLKNSLRIKNQNGRLVSIINSKGYPVLRDQADVLYVLENYGSTLSSFSFNGELLWTRQFLAPLSCFSAKGSKALIGISNGSILLVGNSGVTVSTFSPKLSRLAVTVACSLHSSNMVAAIIGIDPQNLYVLDMADGFSPTVLHEIVLSSNFRTEVPIGITSDNSYVFFPTETQLVRLDLKTGNIKSIIDIELEDMYLDGDVVFFLGRTDEKRLLVWTSTDGKVLGSLDLPNSISISVSEDNIFMGLDTKILSINIVNR